MKNIAKRNGGVYHEVIRPLKVKVQARDENGKLFNLSADGLLARVIQHEYDHLEGKLFVDRLDKEEKEKVLKAYEKRQKRGGRRK